MNAPPTLLLVDDEKAVLHALQRLLRRDGYHLLTATSGCDALVLMANHPVQVVIADQRMPGMSGVELLAEVRNRYPDCVRVILSGYADFNAVTAAINDGAVYKFLSKPWDDDHLRLLVREALLHHRRFRQHTHLAHVFEKSLEGIMITNPKGLIESVNPAFVTITGYAAEEAVGRDANLLRSDRHDRAFFAEMWKTLLKTGMWHGEIWNRRKNGEVYPEWRSITAIRDGEGQVTHFVAMFVDITDRKESERRLQYQQRHDSLTGLPNRSLFLDRLRLAVEHCRGCRGVLAVLFLGLDRFKMVNDSCGQAVGDALLVEVGKRVSHTIRRDDAVARVGGDEFAVLVAQLPQGEEVLQVAEHLLKAIDVPFQVDGHTLRTTASLGIALFPHDGGTPDELLNNAEAAMRSAKGDGRHLYRSYSPALDNQAARRLAMKDALHLALEEGQLQLYYQPQVALGSGRLKGAEALARWFHPEWGMVPPCQFIPLAEEEGLIDRLGEWALRTACRQAREWQKGGMAPLRMAVNVSARQFLDGNFDAILNDILRETGLAPHWLELELTESLIMRNPDASLRILDRLVGLGVSLALDDFGTGYSSLAYLKRFPFDVLKIDQSFVRGLGSDPDDAAIVETVLGLGKNFRLTTLAEGVERQEQMDFLRAHGCDLVQGFLVAKPMPAQAFVQGMPFFTG